MAGVEVGYVLSCAVFIFVASFPGVVAALVMVDATVRENISVMQIAYIFVFLVFILYPHLNTMTEKYNKVLICFLYKIKILL